MPNLTTEAVMAWLDTHMPNTLPGEWPPAIRTIEDRDRHPDLLGALGEALDHAAQTDSAAVTSLLTERPGLAHLRPVLAQLGSARLLRLLHWTLESDLSDAQHATALLLSGDDPNARSLRAALHALSLRATVNRVFSPERIAELGAACAAAEQETV